VAQRVALVFAKEFSGFSSSGLGMPKGVGVLPFRGERFELAMAQSQIGWYQSRDIGWLSAHLA